MIVGPRWSKSEGGNSDIVPFGFVDGTGGYELTHRGAFAVESLSAPLETEIIYRKNFLLIWRHDTPVIMFLTLNLLLAVSFMHRSLCFG